MDKQTVKSWICGALEERFNVTSDETCNGNAKFSADFGLDSLDVVEFVMMCEDEFHINIPDRLAENVVDMTLDEVVDLVYSRVDKN